MVKSYKGKNKTIEVDDNNLIIVSSGFFSSAKKKTSLKDIVDVDIAASSFLSAKDSVYIKFSNGEYEKIQFSSVSEAKAVSSEIFSIVKKAKQKSPGEELLGSFLKIGSAVVASAVAEKERKRQIALQKQAEEKYNKAIQATIDNGHMTTATYVNGKELVYPKSKNGIKAVFIAQYARSPRSVEYPWAEDWHTKYGIKNIDSYLASVVADGYLEEALLGKALSTMTATQLKEILVALDMKQSGSKGEMIQRLLDEADEENVRTLLPTTIYALTPKGISFLHSNEKVLESLWIDCEKAIRSGENVVPEFKKAEKETAKKKRTPKKVLTEEEKRKEYKKAVKALYEALKGHDVQESMTVYKSSHPSHEELEDDMHSICANAAYSPIPYTATMGALRKYKEYYSDEIVDQIYKSQTRYMLFDKDGFKDLLHRIANDENFDYFKFIDDQWDKFVTQYMKTH